MNITKRAKNVKQQWWLVNAENKVLGRLATRISDILTGKRKTNYSHDIVCGDFIIVINAEKIKLTGNKLKNKLYRWHSGYPGHLKEKPAGEILAKKPDFLILQAIKGMLPKNKLRARHLKRIKIYPGENHPHKAQQPIAIDLIDKESRDLIKKAQAGELVGLEEQKPTDKPEPKPLKKGESEPGETAMPPKADKEQVDKKPDKIKKEQKTNNGK